MVGKELLIDKELYEELKKLLRIEVDRKAMNLNTAALVMNKLIDKGVIVIDENSGLDDVKRHLLNTLAMVHVAFMEYYPDEI